MPRLRIPTQSPFLLTPLFVLLCILGGANAACAAKLGGISSGKETSPPFTPQSSEERRPSLEEVILEMELLLLKKKGEKKMRRMFNLIEAGCGRWERWCVYV